MPQEEKDQTPRSVYALVQIAMLAAIAIGMFFQVRWMKSQAKLVQAMQKDLNTVKQVSIIDFKASRQTKAKEEDKKAVKK